MKVPPLYKFLDFIDINKVDWEFLSENPNAIPLLEKYPDNICWFWISQNQSIFEIEIDYELFTPFYISNADYFTKI